MVGDYQKWVAKLIGYDFVIEYKKGLENTAANALSRLPTSVEFSALSFVNSINPAIFTSQVEQDNHLRTIRQTVREGGQAPVGYSVQGDLVLYKGRIALPTSSPTISLLLQEFHNNPVGGHNEVVKMYQHPKGEFFWIGMKASVRAFVGDYYICQQAKYMSVAPGLLQPLPVPQRIWEDISMDFIDGLPRSEGYNSILVVVDHLSKYAHFIPLKHPYTAIVVATIFLKEIVRLHGLPKSIILDRDKVFTSLFWEELFRLMGTHLKRSTAYYPQTDGQTEVVNRGLEAYLRCFTMETLARWAKWLAWVEYNYNTSYHTSLKKTPFEVVCGRTVPSLVSYTNGATTVDAVDLLLQDRDAMLKELCATLERTQQWMKKLADEK